ncbi:MAG: ABC transporter ATP-binding protein [Clostridia bacterium]|nr:ABC transporter ATP-binding protein [Clostridia bacterium]
MSVTIRIDHAHKRYGSNVIIEDLSVRIRQGEFFTLLGPSGCGKTTLLRMIAGFNSIEGGDFYFNDTRINDIDPSKRRIGMVFQNYAIFPHLSVRDNVMFGLKNQPKKMDKAEMRTQTEKFMQLMHIEEYADRKPERLSGGQQQRVALARALVIQPDVLLMDEPLSNLDAKLRVEMRETIRNIQRNVGITTVYVTHDQEEAMAVSDRIAVMNLGKIQQIGTPQAIYQRPANLFVANFIGRTNLLNGEIRMEDGQPVLSVAGGYAIPVSTLLPEAQKNQSVIVSVRPEEFVIAREDENETQGIPATVMSSTFLGLNMHYFLKLTDGTEAQVIQEAELDSCLPEGAKIHLQLKRNKINIFCQDGSRNLVRGVTNDNVSPQEA